MAPLCVCGPDGVAPGSVSRRLARPKSVIFGSAVLGEQDVARLEVAVDDAALVGVMHGPGQRLDQARGLGPAAAAGRRICAASVPPPTYSRARYDVPGVAADLVDLHDAGVLQAGDGLRLQAKTRQLFRAGIRPGEDHLEGDEAVERHLPGLVDHPHAAAAQLFENLEAGDGRPGLDRRRRRGRGQRSGLAGGGRRRGRADGQGLGPGLDFFADFGHAKRPSAGCFGRGSYPRRRTVASILEQGASG